MTPDSKRRATLRTIVAAGSMLLVVSGNAGAQAIVKIGCVLPLSGGSAPLGNQPRVGVRTAVEQINAAGGIKAMGGAKLQALFGDSQSKADVGVSETERLIQRENVAVLCAAFNNALPSPPPHHPPP